MEQKKDLDGALSYYGDYIRTCGSNENIDKEIEAIKKELGDTSFSNKRFY